MVPMPVPVVAPANLFGLEVIDLVLADNSRFRGFAARRQQPRFRRDRRQWCGLRARSKRGSARYKSKGEFQKVAAFHDISLLCNR
jgi:hypothetical protein